MTDTGPLRETPRGVRIELRVMPRSPRAGIEGVRDGRILVRVTAPPVDHAANEAVVTVLAEALDVPKRAVRIVAGQTARNKAVEIEGVDAATAIRMLSR